MQGLPRIISLWVSSMLPRDVKPLVQDVHGCGNFPNSSDLMVAQLTKQPRASSSLLARKKQAGDTLNILQAEEAPEQLSSLSGGTDTPSEETWWPTVALAGWLNPKKATQLAVEREMLVCCSLREECVFLSRRGTRHWTDGWVHAC